MTKVECRGIEPRFSVCKTDVFPLDELPIKCCAVAQVPHRSIDLLPAARKAADLASSRMWRCEKRSSSDGNGSRTRSVLIDNQAPFPEGLTTVFKCVLWFPKIRQSAWKELNLQPSSYKDAALTTEPHAVSVCH